MCVSVCVYVCCVYLLGFLSVSVIFVGDGMDEHVYLAVFLTVTPVVAQPQSACTGRGGDLERMAYSWSVKLVHLP